MTFSDSCQNFRPAADLFRLVADLFDHLLNFFRPAADSFRPAADLFVQLPVFFEQLPTFFGQLPSRIGLLRDVTTPPKVIALDNYRTRFIGRVYRHPGDGVRFRWRHFRSTPALADGAIWSDELPLRRRLQ